MAAGATYEPIATTTLGSAASSYTFSSIPSTYTDLVLVVNGAITSNNQSQRIQFNGDTGSNYSYTTMGATSGGTNSVRAVNTAFVPFFVLNGGPSTSTSANIVIINNYSNATTNKSLLIRANYGDGEVQSVSGLWRSTAAINSLTISTSAGNLSSGSQLTLYGIKAA